MAPRRQRPRWHPWEDLAYAVLTHYLTQRRADLAAMRIYHHCHWVTTLGRLDAGQLRTWLAAPGMTGEGLLPLQVVLPGVSQAGDGQHTGKGAPEASQPDWATKRSARLAATVRGYPEPFTACRDVILAAVGPDPALFSLALLIPEPLTFADLAQVAGRARGTELLLAVDGAQLTRLARREVVTTTEAHAPVPGTDARRHPLTDLLRSDAWKRLWQEHEAPVLPTLQLLATQIRRLYPLVFVADLPAPGRPEPWQPSGHYLIYATRAADAALLMNDFLVAEEVRCHEAVWATILQGDWFRARAAAIHAQLLDDAHVTLLELLDQRRAPFWPDLRLLLAARAFGRLATASYDALLYELLASGALRCHWAPRRDTLPAGTLPGPQDRLELARA
jgi:hypothetical protein